MLWPIAVLSWEAVSFWTKPLQTMGTVSICDWHFGFPQALFQVGTLSGDMHIWLYLALLVYFSNSRNLLEGHEWRWWGNQAGKSWIWASSLCSLCTLWLGRGSCSDGLLACLNSRRPGVFYAGKHCPPRFHWEPFPFNIKMCRLSLLEGIGWVRSGCHFHS